MLDKLKKFKQNLKKDVFEPDTMEFICRACKYEVHVKAEEEDIEKITCKGPSGEHHPEQEMVRND